MFCHNFGNYFSGSTCALRRRAGTRESHVSLKVNLRVPDRPEQLPNGLFAVGRLISQSAT